MPFRYGEFHRERCYALVFSSRKTAADPVLQCANGPAPGDTLCAAHIPSRAINAIVLHPAAPGRGNDAQR